MVGRTIGHYRIVEKIGEGGMGIVYKAQDTHLDRLVAIKLLPPDKVSDPDRKRRFVLEAKAASALNHTNIVHIYDISEADGFQYIAMEFIHGRTLDRVIGRKGMPLGEALSCAVQIAEALARAHSAGILHRDLKPTNVMIADGGLVKLVDFGLAKLTHQSSTDETASTKEISDGAAPPTQEGQIIGTTAYMSPEQAEGKLVDARSDIFSVGALLYEMITGERAFRGETRASVIAAILTKEPRPVSEIAVGIPRELDRIITRCLRKNPEYRFQTAADLKVALRELKEESDSGRLHPPANEARRANGRRVLVYVPLAAVMILLVIGIALLLSRDHNALGDRPASIRITSDSGFTAYPAVSPDGKLLAYASDRAGAGHLDVWVKRLPDGVPLRLTRGDSDNYDPCFLLDGSGLLFYSERNGGGIYKILLPGGQETSIETTQDVPRWPGNDFLPAAGQRRYVLWQRATVGFSDWTPQPNWPRISYAQFLFHKLGGGVVSPDWLWELRMEYWPGSPPNSVLVRSTPKQPPFLFERFTDRTDVETGLVNSAAARGIDVVSLNAWIQDRVGTDMIVFTGQQDGELHLWQVSLSPKTRRVTSGPVRLTSGPGSEGQLTVANDGTAVYARGTTDVNLWMLPIDPNTARPATSPRQLTYNLAGDYDPSISADGRFVVYASNRSRASQIYLRDLENEEEDCLDCGSLSRSAPVIARDGSDVAYSIRLENGTGLYTFSRKERRVQQVCRECGPAYGWSSDNTRLLFAAKGDVWFWDRNSNTKTAVVRRGFQGSNSGRKTAVVQPRPPAWIDCSRLSPDDRWIAFAERRLDGPVTLYIAPFKWTEVDRAKSIEVASEEYGSVDVDWSSGGDVLYFTSSHSGFDDVSAQRLDALTRKPVGERVILQRIRTATKSFVDAEPTAGGFSRYVSPPLGISVSRNKLVFTVQRSQANVFLTNLFGNPISSLREAAGR